jgi:NADPH:quinone reductase-like Zn-dependent oxidoreductase
MVLEKPYSMVLREVPVPRVRSGEVLVKIKYCDNRNEYQELNK